MVTHARLLLGGQRLDRVTRENANPEHAHRDDAVARVRWFARNSWKEAHK
jgi:hypothetical protein